MRHEDKLGLILIVDRPVSSSFSVFSFKVLRLAALPAAERPEAHRPRLGAYEILYTDTPDRAAINEAVELAKRFGSAQSAHFVNGILDKFLHRKEV